MGDKQIRQLKLALQLSEKIHHLRTNRNIQCAYGLIQHQKLRPQGQRPCNIDSLPLPSAELVRESLQCGSIHSNRSQHLRQSCGQAFHWFLIVNRERLRQNLAYAHSRIQRAIWILKYDLHAPPHSSHLL